MQNRAGIYIKVGDDSVGDYTTHYLGGIDTDNLRTWAELLGFLANSIEGLTTYHEERQQAALPIFEVEDIESRKAQGWRFGPEIDQA